VGEDMSMCPTEDNLTIEFLFEAQLGARLTDKINSVDVLVFDAQNLFVESRRLSREELAASPYVSFTLWPGDYLATAWANVASSSLISPLEKYESLLEEGYVSLIGAGDSLWYAPARENLYTSREAALSAEQTKAEAEETETEADPYFLHRVQVPKGGGRIVKEMSFVRAYRAVNIYFQGIENLPSPPDGGWPQMLSVEGVNLESRYDLLFNSVVNSRRDYSRLCTETLTPSGKMQLASFFMSYAPITNDIAFNVGNLPEDFPSLSIGLAEYLKANPALSLDDIDILVGFAGPDRISITAPDWESQGVDPLIDF
jgi:hypothetical protein